MSRHPIAIVVHGGAGTIERGDMTAAQEKAYRAKLTEALEAGHAGLEKGGRAIDAVQAAIEVMESANSTCGSISPNRFPI